MRQAPSNRRKYLAIGTVIGAGALLATPGCDYLDISGVDRPPPPTSTMGLGALCPIAVDTHMSTHYTLDSNSAACPAHICIIPPHQKTTDTTALCSQECQTDADCQGAELRDPHDPMDTRCQSGFSCQEPLPPVAGTSVPMQCHKLCACNDFFDPAHPPFTCP